MSSRYLKPQLYYYNAERPPQNIFLDQQSDVVVVFWACCILPVCLCSPPEILGQLWKCALCQILGL